MNNNMTTERALLGVFEKTSYASVGIKDSPVPYGTDGSVPAHWKGKQFGVLGVQHSQKADITDVYFDKKHTSLSEGDKYVDKLRYVDTQKEKKKGFLTSDFSKRDEFSNTVRTLQWREQLAQEAKWTGRAIGALSGGKVHGDSAAVSSTAAASAAAAVSAADLYDRLHECEKDPGPLSRSAMHVHRDTSNATQLSYERRYGQQSTSSRSAFAPPQAHTPPEFGHKPLISGTFYRRSGFVLGGAP